MIKLPHVSENKTPPYPDNNIDIDSHMKSERGLPPSTPRWVKVFGIITLVLVLLFVILHLTGRGFVGHGGHMSDGSGVLPQLEFLVQLP